MKRKYTVSCWRSVAKSYEVEATSEDEAKKIARDKFEDEDLNKLTTVDYGVDIG